LVVIAFMAAAGLGHEGAEQSKADPAIHFQ